MAMLASGSPQALIQIQNLRTGWENSLPEKLGIELIDQPPSKTLLIIKIAFIFD